MAKEKGTNFLLKVDTGESPTAFQSLSGQRTGTLRISGTEIDTSDKTTSGWSTYLSGLRDMEVTCGGVANWPDTDGLDRIRSQFTAGNDIDARVVLNSAGAYYEATWSIQELEIDAPHDGETSYSIRLKNTVAPTYASSGG